tara:strand:- start:1543 stop:1755 length:213 start_codon:yes stop_codon:yes gene_type:complete
MPPLMPKQKLSIESTALAIDSHKPRRRLKNMDSHNYGALAAENLSSKRSSDRIASAKRRRQSEGEYQSNK